MFLIKAVTFWNAKDDLVENYRFLTTCLIFQTGTLKIQYYEFAIKRDSSGID